MPFSGRLEGLVGKVKEQVDLFSNQHAASKQQQQQQQQQPPPQQPIPGPSRKPYWQANFDPSAPVSAQFKHQLGDWGWGNNELQNYTADSANSFFTADHKLTIRAIANSHGADHQKYTSARLTSHQTTARQLGCLEVSLNPPSAPAVWPAFWLLPNEPFTWPTEGEVDIVESWNGNLQNLCSLHWGQFNAQDANKHRTAETPLPDLTRPQGHHFAFAWNQPVPGQGGKMVWYVDGRAVMKVAIPEGLRPMANWQIIINVAMGGNVNNGAVPADGSYDFVLNSLALFDEPEGGWDQFNNDFNAANGGHGM